MYIFEGRGKGATWSLLLEALHNQGVVIVHDSGNADFIRNHTIKQLEDQKLISSIGADYLMNAVFSINEWIAEGENKFKDSPVYLDKALPVMETLLRRHLGVQKIDIMALGNDDEQVIDPFQRRERYNSFVMEQKREDINEELHKRWRNT